MARNVLLDRDGAPIPVGKEPKMKVKVLRSFSRTGSEVANVGDTIEVSAAEAQTWIKTGRVAAAVDEPEAGSPAADADELVADEPKATHREPRRATR